MFPFHHVCQRIISGVSVIFLPDYRASLKKESTNYCRLSRCWVWRTKGRSGSPGGCGGQWPGGQSPHRAGGCPEPCHHCLIDAQTQTSRPHRRRRRHLRRGKNLENGAAPGGGSLGGPVLPSNQNGKKAVWFLQIAQTRKLQKHNHIFNSTTISSFDGIQNKVCTFSEKSNSYGFGQR